MITEGPRRGSAWLGDWERVDLSGRLVRRLVERRAVSTGEYAISWDGKDASGAQVPPGIYYVRLRLTADKGGVSTSKTEVLRMVSVAY